MSTLRINNITDKAGKQGPVIAGVTTVSSTSHMVIPSGHTGQKYSDEGEDFYNIMVRTTGEELAESGFKEIFQILGMG